MSKIVGFFGILMLIVPLIAGSDPPAGPAPPDVQPWEWTAEDRIRARYDPEGIERRRRAAESEEHGGVPIAPGFQVIDGRNDAALLFEWELFDALTSTAYGPDPDVRDFFRAEIEENMARLEDFEMPVNLWETIEILAADILESLERQRALAAGLPEASRAEAADLLARIESLQADDCARRRAALSALQKVLGRETVLRILYQGVAPGYFIQEPDIDRGEVLVFVQEGCS